MNELDQDATPQDGRRYNKLAAAAAAAAVAGAGVLMFAVDTTSSNAAPAAKYFVCKFVGTPGVDETLQTGQNPISVSGNAIKEDPIVVGSFFVDKQGRSFVLSVDDTPPGPAGDPDVSACDLTAPTSSAPGTETSSGGTEPSSSSNPPVVTVTATAAPTSEVAPVPGAVAAGRHTTSNTGPLALGGTLMALGLGGLAAAVRPWKRATH